MGPPLGGPQLIASARSGLVVLDSGIVEAEGSGLKDLQRQMQQERVAEEESLENLKCGPPWGGPDKGWMTCALDSCVVVAMLLGVQSRNDDDQTKFLELAQYNWQDLVTADAMKLKEVPFQWLVNHLNKDLLDKDKLTVQSNLPLSRVLRFSLKDFRSSLCDFTNV
ncbi:MAG: hypothetical protein M1839_002253 [Geoglossum umbratile]|nr:MAG: hypothetical protein M1839_002253 [Geoglossum umbratile]